MRCKPTAGMGCRRETAVTTVVPSYPLPVSYLGGNCAQLDFHINAERRALARGFKQRNASDRLSVFPSVHRLYVLLSVRLPFFYSSRQSERRGHIESRKRDQWTTTHATGGCDADTAAEASIIISCYSSSSRAAAAAGLQ